MTTRCVRVAASTAILATAVAGLAVTTMTPAGAAACTFDQVTHEDAIVVRTAINATGDLVAFSSTADLTGENADENLELFLWDVEADDFDQLTVTTGSANQPFFAMDDSGDRIAVLSPRNLDPPDNADLNVEAFLYDHTLDTFVQLTTTTGANVNTQIDISGDGNRVAYISTANLIGQNADGNAEVFLRTLPSTTVQVTNTTGGAASAHASPSLDLDGDRLAFESTRDLVPGQNPSGVDQVFVRNLTAGTFTQVTHNPVGPFIVRTDLSANGALVAYSTGAVIAGPNTDGNFEYYRTRVSDGTSVRFTDGIQTNSEGTLTAAGDRLAWLGEQAVAEGSSPVLNLNVSDIGGNRNTVAEAVGATGVEGLSMSADGTRIAFASHLDLIGQNGDHKKALYVATCGPAAPLFSDVPRTSTFFDQIQWMSRVGVATGFPDGTFHPLDPVKRQQMANFIFNLAGNPLYTPPGTPDFSDVPLSHPAYQAIEWMFEFGVAAGFPDDTFRPLDPVKRQQMAGFLYNLAGEPAFVPPVTPTFNDVPTTSPFYLEVEWMAAEDIASGFPDGGFRPQDPVKRQQMANFMYRFQRVTDLES